MILNKTLQDLFLSLSDCSDQGITFITSSDKDVFLSYKDLYYNATKSLGNLQEYGVKPGNELVFQLQDTQTFIETFWACILGKIIPIPLNLAVTNDLKNKLHNVIAILKSPYLVTTKDNFSSNSNFGAAFDDIFEGKIIFIDNSNTKCIGRIEKASVDDIAYIQFSSGSTGNPKGVILTHQNLLANIKSIHQGINYPKQGDKFYSWMPLTHDMGLIGFHLTPLAKGWNHYIMPTELFMRNPTLWVKKIDEYKITFTSSPNFGYQYLLKHFRPENNQDVDLSSLRIIVNGAEPISLDICDQFNKFFSKYGLKQNTIFPVYGLAEASLAVSFTNPEEEIYSIRVSRNDLIIGNKICEVKEKEYGIEFVSVGTQIENTYLRIVDVNGNILKNNFVGNIQIKGDNVTSGYYNNEVATGELISEDGWLNTGDLGFNDLIGNLFIVGRSKDIIFVNGVNYYTYDLERITEKIKEIELGKIVISGEFNPRLGRDEILAFILFRGNLENFLSIKEACQKVISEEIGINLDQVIPVKNIPKTTSGKVQRYKLLTEYLKGKFKDVLLALDELDGEKRKEKGVLPKNEFEIRILECWQKVLGKNDIHVNDDFFVSGGDSLKAGQLILLLQEELNLDVSLVDFYNYRTIHKLAKLSHCPIIEESEILDSINIDKFGLSHAQNRIFYHHHINKDSVAYNISQAFLIEGTIDVIRLNNAFFRLISRYDILRTTFHMQGTSAYQKIKDTPVVSLEEIPRNYKLNIEEQMVQMIEPFALDKLPLIKGKFGKYDDSKTFFFIDIHHIVADGTSLIKLIQELFQLYEGNLVKTPTVQYIDHVLWEEKFLKSQKIEKFKKFWLIQFQDDIPQLTLPFDFSLLKSDLNEKGAKYFGTLGKEVANLLDLFSAKHELSKSAVLFSSYSILLHKLTGQEDIIIGMAESGRNHSKFFDAVGMFVNNLPIRLALNGNSSINEYLSKVNEHFIKVLDNKALPYNELLNLLDIKTINGRNPLFDTMFVYHNMEIPKLSTKELGITHLPFDPKISKFDISLEIIEGDELNYAFEYSTSLFNDNTVKRFSGYFEIILKTLIENIELQIKDIDILSVFEKKHLLSDFNATNCNYTNALIHELFEEQALRNPNPYAVISGNDKLTYKELNKKADDLAIVLLDNGIRVEDFVVILADRSIEFIISLLGVLKAGGAYVPIDVSYPKSRKEYIIEDCNAKFILTTKHIRNVNGEICSTFNESKIFYVDELDTFKLPAKRKPNKIKYDNLAYMIYTSGTSGTPKGVMIEHRNLMNYISWAQKVYVKEEVVNFPLFTSVAFDLTVTSIFTPLVTGNSIVIYKEDDQHLLIEKVLMDDKVGVIKLTPSHLRIIKDDHKINPETIKNLKRFIVGGEDLSADLAQDISSMFNDQIEIYNEYGPTEATVGCMIYKYNSHKNYNKSVPIGSPSDNSEIFILDNYLKPVVLGVTGEIYIGGSGVGRGYHKKENLTIERFVLIPEISNGRLYKTGDLARFVEGNGIEFIGRSDQQVKINGYRIELDEIELCIKKFYGIKNAIVSKVDNAGSTILCAYYVADIEIADSVLREFLQGQLPHYMVPSLFFNIDNIPLTSNGKVNTEALSSLYGTKNLEEYQVSENEIQEQLVNIFQDVLNLNKIGINDNFFELGGDSIKAVQITSRLYDKGISLNVKDILSHQTISKISLYAENSDREYDQGIISGEKQLTPIEKWFFDQEFENPNHYNQSVLLEFKENIDTDKLQKSFKKLTEHHDGLRLNYNPEKNCMFYNNEHLNSGFTVEEFTIDYENSLEFIGAKLKTSFDITSDLLIKAAIIKEQNKPDRLLITAHHIVIDGISWRILLEDLYNIYKSLDEKDNLLLPKKTGSLLDWQGALKEYSESDELKKQTEYWKQIETMDLHLFNANKSLDASENKHEKFQFTLDEAITDFLLKDANKPYNTNIQILLIATLSLAIKEWSGKNSLVIEMENYGRNIENVDVSRTVGWFTALYPVKFDLASNDIGSIIKHVKEQIRQIPGDGIGYGVSKYLSNELILSHEKKNEIRFNYLGQFGQEASNNLFSYINDFSGNEISENNHPSTKLEVNSLIINNELNLEFIYNKEVFENTDITIINQSLLQHIETLVSFLKNEDDLHFTSSDFDGVELDDDDLNILFS